MSYYPSKPFLKIGLILFPISCPLSAETGEAQYPDKTITSICLGSCHRTGRNAHIWSRIAEQSPQLFVFMGDNIYADTEDMAKMKADYAALNAIPQYKKLKKKTQVIATWDDHDYGVNDGGHEYPKREQARDIMLDAFDVPKEAAMRSRKGIYQSHSYGKEGSRLQVILLDTRYFRSALSKLDKVYLPAKGEEATMLGKEQWKWLEKQLQQPADVRLLVSSIQFLNAGHRFEKWANMPDEQQRLIDLLKSSKTINQTIILSGDRHFAEFSHRNFENGDQLWELTSSGMTHAGGGHGEKNPYNVKKSYYKRNFASLKIDWQAKPTLKIAIHDKRGKVVQSQEITVK